MEKENKLKTIHVFGGGNFDTHKHSVDCHCDPEIIVSDGYLHIIHVERKLRLFPEWSKSFIHLFKKHA